MLLPPPAAGRAREVVDAARAAGCASLRRAAHPPAPYPTCYPLPTHRAVCDAWLSHGHPISVSVCAPPDRLTLSRANSADLDEDLAASLVAKTRVEEARAITASAAVAAQVLLIATPH